MESSHLLISRRNLLYTSIGCLFECQQHLMDYELTYPTILWRVRSDLNKLRKRKTDSIINL